MKAVARCVVRHSRWKQNTCQRIRRRPSPVQSDLNPAMSCIHYARQLFKSDRVGVDMTCIEAERKRLAGCRSNPGETIAGMLRVMAQCANSEGPSQMCLRFGTAGNGLLGGGPGHGGYFEPAGMVTDVNDDGKKLDSDRGACVESMSVESYRVWSILSGIIVVR